ncbi:MAG: hypothetical protein AB3N21_18770 [Ruegeria sp.]|uniref:hypothetical protein n=1 Tax=Ruegeria sp. TaxID=1879320 RepID=UPI00349E9121
MTLAVPLSNSKAERALSSAIGKTIEFCHAEGGCLEADEHGLQEQHTLWGNVSLAVDEDASFALTSHNDALQVSEYCGQPGLNAALGHRPRAGIYLRGLGDFTPISQLRVFEDRETSALIVNFEAGGLVVFEACAKAISVTISKKDTETAGLWAERLQTAKAIQGEIQWQ